MLRLRVELRLVVPETTVQGPLHYRSQSDPGRSRTCIYPLRGWMPLLIRLQDQIPRPRIELGTTGLEDQSGSLPRGIEAL